jgi:thiol-disulfide isomerase/thioredoxin
MADSPQSSKHVRRANARADRERARRRAVLAKRARAAAIAVMAIVIAFAVGFFFVRGSSSGVAYAGDIRRGGTLEKLELPELRGDGRIDYSAYAEKPLVINFFASWCPNCIGEMPGFEQVHQKLGDRVGFLGISQSDARDASIALADQTGISYATGIDANGAFFNAAGGIGMPTTIFVKPGGQIADVWVGALDPTSLERLITQDLGVSAS